MKKLITISLIIFLFGASFYLKDYINPRPLPQTIWIEKDISKNEFLRPNTSRDTVLILEVKGDFLQTESTYFGLIENYSIKTFKAKFERCLECELSKFETK